MISEGELLARCRRGDSAAWDELFDRHYAATGRFVAQVASDATREDVEEICQETFLTAIRSLAGFKDQCQVQTWLFRIAANKTSDYRERFRAAKRGGGLRPLSLHESDAETGLTLDPPSSAPSPDFSLIQTEEIGLVAKALDQLGEPCREVIQLRYFADLSYEEISSSLQLNPKTVSSRLSKCLDKLEELVKRLLLREEPVPVPVQ